MTDDPRAQSQQSDVEWLRAEIEEHAEYQTTTVITIERCAAIADALEAKDAEIARLSDMLAAQLQIVGFAEMRKDLAATRAERDALLVAMAMDQPWPLPDVLAKLVEATEHLLTVHGCDTHGHEEFRAATKAAKSIVKALRAPQTGVEK